MKITKQGWAALTVGEKLSAIAYVVSENKKRWQRKTA